MEIFGKIYWGRLKAWEYGITSDEFTVLLLIASQVRLFEGQRKGIDLEPGEALISRGYIQQATGFSDRHIRTVLKNVQRTGQIATKKATKQGTVIRLLPQSIFGDGTTKTTNEATTEATRKKDKRKDTRHSGVGGLSPTTPSGGARVAGVAGASAAKAPQALSDIDKDIYKDWRSL